MELAYINGEVLRWAQERSGLTKAKLAEDLGVPRQLLAHWEAGIEFPAFGRAQKLANALRIPFGYLFLSNPPTQTPPIPDLRTVDGERRPPSPEFADLLNDVLVKHDWYLEYLKKVGSRPVPFVGKYSVSDQMSQVVADVRRVIDPEELRRHAASLSEYIRLLAERAESVDILVMRGGVVRGNPNRGLSVEEFRGFALSDRLAPLIFINAKDAQAAQVFTLAHELIHLWIGQSGISNPNSESPDQDRRQASVEQFCNRAAAELLVPSQEFESVWRTLSGDSEAKVDHLAKKFKVSVPVILRRALDGAEISRPAFFSLLRVHQDKVRELERRRQQNGEESSSGGNFYNTFFVRNSRKFSRAVTADVRSGGLSTLEAARMLNVRTSIIPKIAERIAQ